MNIPEPLLKQMIELFGEEKATKIAKNVGYSYNILILNVADVKFKRKYGVRLSILFLVIVVATSLVSFAIQIVLNI